MVIRCVHNYSLLVLILSHFALCFLSAILTTLRVLCSHQCIAVVTILMMNSAFHGAVFCFVMAFEASVNKNNIRSVEI